MVWHGWKVEGLFHQYAMVFTASLPNELWILACEPVTVITYFIWELGSQSLGVFHTKIVIILDMPVMVIKVVSTHILMS